MKTLSNIATISLGYSFRGRIEEQTQGNVLIVQMKNVTEDQKINWSSCTKTELKSPKNTHKLQVNDILLISKGSHFTAVLIDEMPSSQYIASSHFYIIRVKDDNNLLPPYLCWALNQAPCQSYFQSSAEGTLYKSIRKQTLEQVPIAMPELSKQHHIIRLSKNMNQQKNLLEKLIHNQNQIMSGIASQIWRQGESL